MPNTGQNAILVVGAGSGIGKAIVESLIALKEELVVADLNLDYWSRTELGKPHQILIDVLSESSLNDLVLFLKGKNLCLSGLAFTVGKAITMPLQSMKSPEYNEILRLNTISFFNLVSVLIKSGSFSSKGASIVVISSLVGELGARGKMAYSASKGAINSGIRSLAQELAAQNIRINAISPGTIHSPMLDRLESTIGSDEVKKLSDNYPLGLGYPEDVAALAVYVMSNNSQWMTGSVITIDGGLSAR